MSPFPPRIKLSRATATVIISARAQPPSQTLPSNSVPPPPRLAWTGPTQQCAYVGGTFNNRLTHVVDLNTPDAAQDWTGIQNDRTPFRTSAFVAKTEVETASKIMSVDWVTGVLPDAAADSSATIHAVEYAPDGGVYVVGEFNSNEVIIKDTTSITHRMTSTGGTADGFFLKLDKNGALRHLIQLKSVKKSALTGVQYGGRVGSRERVVMTGKYAGTNAEVYSVTGPGLMLDINTTVSSSALAFTHGLALEFDYEAGLDGSVNGVPEIRWALFVNGKKESLPDFPAATVHKASSIGGEKGGAYVTGEVFGVDADYRLITYFAGSKCFGGIATSAACSGSFVGQDPGQKRDTYVAKIAAETVAGVEVFGVQWIKVVAGAGYESPTSVTHDAATNAVFVTGETTSTSLKVDSIQVMFIDPLDGADGRTLDPRVGFALKMNSATGAGVWCVNGYNAYTATGAVARYGNSMAAVALSGAGGGVYVTGFFTNEGTLKSSADSGVLTMSTVRSEDKHHMRWYLAHVEAGGKIITNYIGAEPVASSNFGVQLPVLVDEYPKALSVVTSVDGAVTPLVAGYAESPSKTTIGSGAPTTIGFTRLVQAYIPPPPPSPPPSVPSPPPPPASPPPSTPSSPPAEASMSDGELAGSIVGGVLGMALVLYFTWLCYVVDPNEAYQAADGESTDGESTDEESTDEEAGGDLGSHALDAPKAMKKMESICPDAIEPSDVEVSTWEEPQTPKPADASTKRLDRGMGSFSSRVFSSSLKSMKTVSDLASESVKKTHTLARMMTARTKMALLDALGKKPPPVKKNRRRKSAKGKHEKRKELKMIKKTLAAHDK